MVYKKYIKRNGKTYGPYSYKSRKENGKVITEYLGHSEDKKEKNAGNRINPLFLFGLGVFAIFLLLFIVNFSMTGKISLSIENYYIQGDSVNGNIKLSLLNGELLSEDAKLIVNNSGEISEFLISNLISDETIQEKIIFPYVYFTLLLENETEQDYESPIPETPEAEPEQVPEITLNDSENISQTESDLNQNSNSSSNAQISGQLTNEHESEGTTSESEDMNTEEFQSGSETEESQSEDEEISEQTEVQEETEEPITNDISEQEQDSEVTPEDSSITGGVIDMQTEISGRVKKDEPFIYSLMDGESVRVKEGSINSDSKILNSSEISLMLQNDRIVVTTDYSEVDGKEILVNISKLNLKAKEGTLTLKLISEGNEIASASQQISVTDATEIPEQNQTQIDETNITEVINQTITETNITEQNITIETNFTQNITIEKNITGLVEERLKTRQARAIIGKPVKWVKSIELENVTENNVTISIPKTASNITIKTGEEVDEALTEIDKYENTINETSRKDISEGKITGMVSFNPNEGNGFLYKLWKKFTNLGITGKAISEEEAETQELITESETEKIVEVSEIAEKTNETDIAVEYYTDAPKVIEEKITGRDGKKITISADDELNYSNILAYTIITDKNISIENSEKIRLYHYVSEKELIKEQEEINEEPLEQQAEIPEQNVTIPESEEDITEESNQTIISNQTIEEPTNINESLNQPEQQEIDESSDENLSLSITGSIVGKITGQTSTENENISELQKENEKNISLNSDFVKVEVEFEAFDFDEDGFIDYIEWNVPHLSEQIYELIYIEKAIHLDENKTFISDIYEEVREQDDIWSETINNGEYVRVTFEEPLDNTKDITIYARTFNYTNDTTPSSIEVYTENGNETLAIFENIAEENWYKVYLENLPENQSFEVFDLKIISEDNSGVEFDYIIDPQILANFSADWNGTFVNTTKIGDNVTLLYNLFSGINYFPVNNEDGNPQDIFWNGSRWFMVGYQHDVVYEYYPNWTYAQISHSVSQDTNPSGIFWNGSNWFMIGYGSDTVYKYNNSWNYTGINYPLSEDSTPTDIFWNGSNWFMIGYGSDTVYKYDSDWIYTGVNYSVSSQENTPTGFYWDGTNWFVVGSNQDTVFKYDSNWSYIENEHYSVEDSTPTDIFWNGSNWFMVGDGSNRVYEYTDEYCSFGTYTKILDAGDVVNWGNFSFDISGIFNSTNTSWELDTAQFDGVNISTKDSSPTGLFFKSDGTKMYETGVSGDKIYQYTCSDAWNISSCNNNFNISSQDSAPTGLFFKSDGTKMYEVGSSTNKIYQYTCSDAWNITSCLYDSVSSSLAGGGVTQGVFFKPDGTKIYTLTYTSDRIYQYTCSDAWNITSCLYDSVSIPTQDATSRDLFFKSDGTKMYEVGDSLNRLYQYTCSDAWNITSCSYSLNISSLDSEPTALFFKPDGAKMYILGDNRNNIYQYTISSAWDISRASDEHVEASVPEIGGSFGMFFKPDGTKIYVVSYGDDKFYQYSLSTPWDITTISYDGISISTQDTNAYDLFFSPDGTKMYETGISGVKIYQYSLSTPWSISSATYSGVNISAKDASPSALFFKPDGTKMYELGYSYDNVSQYTLSSPWNLSTATLDGISFSLSDQSSSPYDLFFSPEGTKMYTIDSTKNIHQYSLTTPWNVATASYDSISVYVGGSTTYGMFFKSDGTKMYVIDAGLRKIYSYSFDTQILKFQVASCDTLNCSGAILVGPGNTSNTYFNYASSPLILNSTITPDNRYLQYKAFFAIGDEKSDEIPVLKSIEVGRGYTEPSVILNSPLGINTTDNGNVTFNCSAISVDFDLTNITLYTDANGIWSPVETQSLSGKTGEGYFPSKDLHENGYLYQNIKWNCYACDENNGCLFAGSNGTFNNWASGNYNLTKGINNISLTKDNLEWNYTGISVSRYGASYSDGMFWDGENWWLLDYQEVVLKFNSDWSYTGVNYTLTQDSSITGIYKKDNYWYATGSTNERIYMYDSNWNSITSYNIGSYVVGISDLCWNGTAWWVVDNNEAVWSFTEDWTYILGSLDSVSSQDNYVKDIFWDGENWWALGEQYDRVYKYKPNWDYTNTYYTLQGSDQTNAFFWDGENWWVDRQGPVVYKYGIYNPLGIYTSEIIDAGEDIIWNNISWTENLPQLNVDYSNTKNVLYSTRDSGITYYNGSFWLLDDSYDAIFQFYPNGSYSEFSFEINSSGNANPYALTAYNDTFWVTDISQDEVYQYYPNGSYSGFSFDTAAVGNGAPYGITSYNNYLWTTDYSTYQIFQYYPNGTLANNFSIGHFTGHRPKNIIYYQGYFWVTNDNNNLVTFPVNELSEDTEGPRLNLGTATSSQNLNPTGIAEYNGNFWIIDGSDTRAYIYVLKGMDVKVQVRNCDDADCYDDSWFGEGKGDPQMSWNYTQEKYNLSRYDLSASGIFWNGSRWYMVGMDSDRVYEFYSNWTYAKNNWSINVGEGSPNALSYVDNNWYILGNETDKVYKYDGSWNYLGVNYSIAQDGNPVSMYWNGSHWYIVGIDSDRIYEYDSSWVYTGKNWTTQARYSDVGIFGNGSSWWIPNANDVNKYDSNFSTSTYTRNANLPEDSVLGDLYFRDDNWYVLGEKSNQIYVYGSFFQNPPANLSQIQSRYFQYRTFLTTSNYTSTPSLNSLSIDYLPSNQAPAVNIVYPVGGSDYPTPNLEINYTVSDPDENLQSCWWTNNSGEINNTITCGTNITGQTWNEGLNTIIVYANDTENFLGSGSVTFTIDTSPPNILFNSQYPSDLDSANIFSRLMNITYNISDSNINLSTVKIYYKTNSTSSNVDYYVNGTAYSGFFSKSYSSVDSETFLFRLEDNIVYPAKYNYEEEEMEHTPHSIYSLIGGTSYVKIRLFNVSDSSQYNQFEIMMNSSGTQSSVIYYCNSSYTSGSILSSDYCTNFYTLAPGTSFNHTHSQYSSHMLIPFSINTTDGTIGTVKITPTSYFAIRGSAGAGNTWSVGYISNVTGANTIQTSSNSGLAWSNFSGTVDSHLHQYSGTDSLWYYVCANDTFSSSNCSVLRQDLIDLSGLPPTSPFVYSPTNQSYSGNVNINYTASLSPNDYTITHYNISLLYPNETFIKTIIQNNSLNLGYILNPVTDSVSDGNYKIKVEAYDSLSQSSFGLSENFTLDTTYPLISITSPENSTNTTDTNLEINYSVSDSNLGSCWWTSNSGATNNSITCGANITGQTWGEGSNTIIVYANDISENENFSRVSFTLDTIAPSFSDLRNFIHVINTSFSNSITATDSGVGVQSYSLNQTTQFSIDSTNGLITNITPLDEVAIYWLNISVNDTIGNKNSGIFYINVTVITDDEYPIFSDLTENPANNSEYLQGETYRFNSTITRLNGSAGIEFNGVNYTANLTGGVSFDGVNDYVYTGDVASLKPSQVTFSTWVKLDQDKAIQFIGGYGTTGYEGYWLGISGNTFKFDIGNHSAPTHQLDSGINPVINQWYHVVGTYDGSEMNIYIDGINKNSAEVFGDISYVGITNDTFVIGNIDGFNSARFWNGTIDEVLIFNRSLSGEEVTQLYNKSRINGLNGIDTTGLVSYYPLDNSFDDFFGGNDGTANGAEFLPVNAYYSLSELSAGTYNYYWWAYGNGTLNRYNTSGLRSYVINKAIPNLIMSNGSASINNSGLVGYWRFENNAFDYSGNENNGTVTGATYNLTGNFGGAYEFDGNDNWVQIPNSPSINISRSLTISLWFKPNINNTRQELISKVIASPQAYLIRYENNNRIRAQINNGSNYFDFNYLSQPEIASNSWHYAAFTFDYETREGVIYVDGKNVSSAITPGNFPSPNNNNLRIGTTANGQNDFNGSIDEVMIWNRALSDSEIKMLYNNSIYYSSPTNVNATVLENQLSADLYLNQTGINNPDNTVRGAADYYYLGNTSGNNNYTFATLLIPFTINKATQSITALLNGVSSDLSITYPQQANATILNNNTASTILMNGTTLISGTNYTMGAGTWTVNYSAIGNQNYSSDETSLILQINPASSVVYLSLNNSRDNITITVGDEVDLVGVLISGEGNVTLYVNDSIINQSSNLQNADYIYNFTIPGTYNVTALYFSTQNYSQSSETFYVTAVNSSIFPIISLLSPADGYSSTTTTTTFQYLVAGDTTINCSLILNDGIANFNSSVVIDGSTINEFISSTPVGSYSWSVNCTDSFNNEANSSTRIFTITSPPTPVSPGGGGGGGGAPTKVDFELGKTTYETTISLDYTEHSQISLTNKENSKKTFTISKDNLDGILFLDKASMTLEAGETSDIAFTITSPNEVGIYTGKIIVSSGNTQKEILVVINVKTDKSLFDIGINIPSLLKTITPGENLKAQINLLQAGIKEKMDVTLNYIIKDFNGQIYVEDSETIMVYDKKTFEKEFHTSELPVGDYVLGVELIYPGGVAVASSQFKVREGFAGFTKEQITLVGIIIVLLAVLLIIFLIIKNYKKRKTLKTKKVKTKNKSKRKKRRK